MCGRILFVNVSSQYMLAFYVSRLFLHKKNFVWWHVLRMFWFISSWWSDSVMFSANDDLNRTFFRSKMHTVKLAAGPQKAMEVLFRWFSFQIGRHLGSSCSFSGIQNWTFGVEPPDEVLVLNVHPGSDERLVHLQITPFIKENDLNQTSMIMFHVNLQGCMCFVQSDFFCFQQQIMVYQTNGCFRWLISKTHLHREMTILQRVSFISTAFFTGKLLVKQTKISTSCTKNPTNHLPFCIGWIKVYRHGMSLNFSFQRERCSVWTSCCCDLRGFFRGLAVGRFGYLTGYQSITQHTSLDHQWKLWVDNFEEQYNVTLNHLMPWIMRWMIKQVLCIFFGVNLSRLLP